MTLRVSNVRSQCRKTGSHCPLALTGRPQMARDFRGRRIAPAHDNREQSRNFPLVSRAVPVLRHGHHGWAPRYEHSVHRRAGSRSPSSYQTDRTGEAGLTESKKELTHRIIDRASALHAALYAAVRDRIANTSGPDPAEARRSAPRSGRGSPRLSRSSVPDSR